MNVTSKLAGHHGAWWTVAIVALTVLLSPLPSAAQEAEVAVSNIDRGHTNTERRTVPLAQGFTTGRRLGGYAIDTVEIKYDDMQGDAF